MIRPGESVHYASLLDEDGKTLVTVPMDNPVAVPHDQFISTADIDLKINVKLELKSAGKYASSTT